MTIPLYVVDAFASQLFRGNPAAVCLLESWLPDTQLANIAAENNLSETAFLVKQEEGWHLRWFTPRVEVPLCGHATLASAFVLSQLFPEQLVFDFQTLSGKLQVSRHDVLFTLDLPKGTLKQQSPQAAKDMSAILKIPVLAVVKAGTNLIAEVENLSSVQDFKPDFDDIAALDGTALMITAEGDSCDFVSRFFAPRAGINEDPVTGSAHCGLSAYWAGKLGKSRLHARQLSQRGGELFCKLRGDRVLVSGYATLYSKGKIYL